MALTAAFASGVSRRAGTTAELPSVSTPPIGRAMGRRVAVDPEDGARSTLSGAALAASPSTARAFPAVFLGAAPSLAAGFLLLEEVLVGTIPSPQRRGAIHLRRPFRDVKPDYASRSAMPKIFD